MSIEDNKGYKAIVQNKPIPHSENFVERQRIADGVNAAKAQQEKIKTNNNNT